MPTIPDPLRAELVRALMAARRAVGATEGASRTEARAAVHEAKVALGERGEPWWEPATVEGRAARIVATTMALLRARRAEASICPSDVARVVGGDVWRRRLDEVRAVLAAEQAAQRLRVTQGDADVEIDGARGPVRIRRGAAFPSNGSAT